ncbi:MAG TPA: MATE family efflux transporter [Caulobacteraceae bacterium]|jgi:MATE family multidrug resistance protein|nr:MATE family efflux transporter [Caulobacteraceae bacterium]
MDARKARTASHPGAPRGPILADLRALLALAGPVVLSRLGIMTMGLTDTIVVGRYSAVQLGYHALGWAPTAVVLTVAISLLNGVQVMTSRAIGEGRMANTGVVLRRGLVYGAQIGIGSTLFLIALGPPFLHHIGLASDLADGASRVMIVFSASLMPLTLGAACSGWLEAMGKPGVAMAMMWLANGVNLAIDLVLVPGGFGLPALGAIGGACATLGSRTALMAALMIFIVRLPNARALGLFAKPPRERAAEAEQRHVGYGAGLSGLFEVASFAGMNLIAGWLGAAALAAYTAVLNVASLVFMVPLGLSTATAVLVGRAYGARDAKGVNRAAWLGLAVAALFGLAVSLAVLPSARAMMSAYTTDPRVLALGAGALMLACVFFLPDALQVVAASLLRARADVWMPSVTHFISYVALMAPLAWFLALPLHAGVAGIIWSINLASFLSAGLLVGRFVLLGRRGL